MPPSTSNSNSASASASDITLTTTTAAVIPPNSRIPIYTTIPLPATPPANHTRLHLLASALHNLVLSRASGSHYTSTATTTPTIPGIDGIALTPTGETIYFHTLGLTRQGSLSTHLDIPTRNTFPLPPQLSSTSTTSLTRLAALILPALGGWMALTRRTQAPQPFTLLLLGATGLAGRTTALLARRLGARRVIGLARDGAALERVRGLDGRVRVVVRQGESVRLQGDLQALADVDVVVDFVYGEVGAAALREVVEARLRASRKEGGEEGEEEGRRVKVEYVHVGAMAGPEMRIPGALLRKADVTIRGSGWGCWGARELREELPALLEGLAELDLEGFDVRREELKDVEGVWKEVVERVQRGGPKGSVVFVP